MALFVYPMEISMLNWSHVQSTAFPCDGMSEELYEQKLLRFIVSALCEECEERIVVVTASNVAVLRYWIDGIRGSLSQCTFDPNMMSVAHKNTRCLFIPHERIESRCRGIVISGYILLPPMVFTAHELRAVQYLLLRCRS